MKSKVRSGQIGNLASMGRRNTCV